MKRLFYLYTMLFVSMTLFAQTVQEGGRTIDHTVKSDVQIVNHELAALVDVVRLLRIQNQENFDKAAKYLKEDRLWTAMSETGKLQDTECKPADKVPGFKLNRILSGVSRERKYVSAKGEMLNGEDGRYDYSLYERSLKKKRKATYTLKKRSGKQTFVVVPFFAQKGSLAVSINGKKLSSTQEDKDGTIICSFVPSGQNISVTIANKSNNHLSFVVINHNSRKK